MKTIEFTDAVRLIDEGAAMPRAQRLQLQKQRLRELVTYARGHSPYFKQLYKDLPENFSLADLPPTEKNVLNEHYNQWVTDPELNKDKVMAYVERDINDTSLLLGRYTALKTSGSTGNPLPMVRDDYHNKIHSSMISRRLMKGIDPELLSPAKHRIATVIHTSPGASSYCGYLRNRAANPRHADNMMAISVLESIDSIVDKLNAFQPEVLTGYASSLILLANEKAKGTLKISVLAICNSAELLTPEAYRRITEAFDCPVLNNYCMTEGGEIAMANGGPEMRLNEDWVIVEPVNADKQPVQNNSEFSDGILITDLSNFVQPIIRYYVSDRVKILPPANDTDFPQLQIDGRVMEAFILGGKQYTMAAIVPKAEIWPGLIKYQAVQTDADTLQIRGVCVPGADCREVLGGLSRQLEAYFHSNGCEKAKITYCCEPLLHNERGGKIPRYINQFQK